MLEPEAASVYCQTSFKRKAAATSDCEAELNHLEDGHKYIVADLGGNITNA